MNVNIKDQSLNKEQLSVFKKLSLYQNIYMKISSIINLLDLNMIDINKYSYSKIIDQILGIFGEDRIIYGSNWPVSNMVADFNVHFDLLFNIFTKLGSNIKNNFFFNNAINVYSKNSQIQLLSANDEVSLKNT